MLRIIKKIVGVCLTLFFIGIVLFIAAALYYARDLPDPQHILKGGLSESTKIYDRTGEVLLYQIGQERRDVIDINQIPQHVKWAAIVAEDEDFYRHPGIDVLAIIRSLGNDLYHRAFVQGGSTITQQFVKNALLSPEKTIPRKIREIILSVWLEARYSKDEILSFYLNQIPYGSNAYGIESAARTFFAKPAQDLTLSEAAVLAALPQRPSYLSPFGEHTDELKDRKEYILKGMAKEGYIKEKEANEAIDAPLAFHPSKESLLAPHFVISIKEYLERTYGVEAVEHGGLNVITTLDWRLQKKAEELVLEQAKKNEKAHRMKNAALVALDPRTGQVVAMVGSRDWFDDSVEGKVNVALRLRQPGSAFKPIAYAKLFEKGFGPETLIFDLQTTFLTRARQPYTPRDFDGKFRGLLTLREALGQSLNVPAVQVLYLAGIDEVITLAKQMGIGSIDPARVDLALVLGGAEVRLLDLASAYSVFASDGVLNPPAFILSVQDKAGKTMEQFSAKSKRILQPEIARLVTSILSDNNARAPLFGLSSPLSIPGMEVAAKTGTTTDFRDGWAMGYTPGLVVGVWAGNNTDDLKPMQAEGAFVAGPIWNKLMRFAVNSFPQEFGGSFPPLLPHRLLDLAMINGTLGSKHVVKIDTFSGKLATDLTPPALIEERSYAQIHSLLYYVRPDDPQLDAWEAPVKTWLLSRPDSLLYAQGPPLEYDDAHTKDNAPEITIITPTPSFVASSDTLEVTFNAKTTFGLKQVEISVDENLVVTVANHDPLSIPIASLTKGAHMLSIKVFDEALNSSAKSVAFTKF